MKPQGDVTGLRIGINFKFKGQRAAWWVELTEGLAALDKGEKSAAAVALRGLFHKARVTVEELRKK